MTNNVTMMDESVLFICFTRHMVCCALYLMYYGHCQKLEMSVQEQKGGTKVGLSLKMIRNYGRKI